MPTLDAQQSYTRLESTYIYLNMYKSIVIRV